MKTTEDKFVQAILVEENGFLFVRYVDENGDKADIEVDVDLDKILQDVRNERIDKIIASLQLPNASSQIVTTQVRRSLYFVLCRFCRKLS